VAVLNALVIVIVLVYLAGAIEQPHDR
jgi:hypothetical protein